MPSPIAHSLAGLAVAHLALRRGPLPPGDPGPAQARVSTLQQIFWCGAFAFAANAADLDFLPGFLIGDPNRFHHGPTHTLIAGVIFGLMSAVVARIAGMGLWRRFGVFMGLSYTTHLLLDLMTRGKTEPYGMKLLWPFLPNEVVPPFRLFMDIRRDSGASTFVPTLIQWHNGKAIALELAIMAGAWTMYRLVSSLQINLNTTSSERNIPQ